MGNYLTTPNSNMLSQDEMKQIFGKLIQTVDRKYSKTGGFLRPATMGEIITTVLDGKEETTNEVKDDTSWIAMGPKGEEYIVTADAFEKSYVAQGTDPEDSELQKKRFKRYPSSRTMYAYEVTDADMETHFPSGHFMGPWGSKMRVEAEDMLVTDEAVSEIYRIDRDVFDKTYVPC